jgi:hypothetical protein
MERNPDEKLYTFLERRERELVHQIAALKGEIEPREIELAHVRSAMRQYRNFGSADRERLGAPAPDREAEQAVVVHAGGDDQNLVHTIYDIASGVARFSRSIKEAQDKHEFLAFEHLTIKELIVKALTDHYSHGASAMELCDFVRNAYGRDVERSSLSPQLSRLRDDGVVEQFQHLEDISAGRPTPGGLWKLADHSNMQVMIEASDVTLSTKLLIMKVIWQNFKSKGATSAELRQFIAEAYGLKMNLANFNSEIAQLRTEAILKEKGGKDNWRLTLKGLAACKAAFDAVEFDDIPEAK